MVKYTVLGLLPLLCGCGITAGIQAAGQQAPGVLGEVEQLKTAVVVAPIAGCVSMIQQVNTQINALKTGAPAIPVSASPVPPIVTKPS